MKKLMSLMIGMSLVLGAATYAFADEAQGKGKSEKKSDKKKKGKKGEDKDKKS